MISGFPITSSRCEKAPYKGELSLKRATGLLDPQVRLLRPTTDSKSGPVCHSLTETSTLGHLMDAYGQSPIRVGVDDVFPAVRPSARILPGEFDSVLCLLRGQWMYVYREAANSSEVCRING